MPEVFDAPIAGESWTREPQTMPYDRPPQFADLDAALDNVFKNLRSPKVTKQLLNILETGMPIDQLSESIISSGFVKGKYGAPMLLPMAAPVTVMLYRMAEAAGIQPKLSSDPEVRGVDFDPMDMMAAQERVDNNAAAKAEHANEISKKELSAPDLADRQGFFKYRPKSKANKEV